MMPSTKSNPTPAPAKTAILEPSKEWQFEAIGTTWWIGTYQIIDDVAWAVLRTTISKRIAEFDRVYSRFRADSLVTSISQHAGNYTFPADATELFDWYRHLYDATDGQVTPLIGQTLSDAGYDATYSFTTQTMVSPPVWDDVISFDAPILTTELPVLLDFGAAGKGYLADIIGESLQQAGIKHYCVDASGDVVVQGIVPGLRIGLEHPEDTGQVIGVATVSDGALCGSAGNRRRWGGFHHVLSPTRLESPDHIAAVWVMADTALHADGLTTALYFVDPDTLLQSFAFEYLIMYANGMITRSADFAAEVFGEVAA